MLLCVSGEYAHQDDQFNRQELERCLGTYQRRPAFVPGDPIVVGITRRDAAAGAQASFVVADFLPVVRAASGILPDLSLIHI